MTARAPSCRSCGFEDLQLVLSLGRMPLANALLSSDQLEQNEPAYPLDLAFFPPMHARVDYRDGPPGTSLPGVSLFFLVLRHHAFPCRSFERADRRFPGVGRPESRGGDRQQRRLSAPIYQQRGIPVLGIEPAQNVARVAREERGIKTLCEFFDAALAQDLKDQGVRPDIIHAHNVLAHVADLNGFVEGLGMLLPGHGVAVIEVPYLKDLIDHCEFDTIYHQHLLEREGGGRPAGAAPGLSSGADRRQGLSVRSEEDASLISWEALSRQEWPSSWIFLFPRCLKIL